jgi:hypothetical protein
MPSGMTIKVRDPDDDYLGIDIQASNDRFAGSAEVYAGLQELSEFAARIAGFPSNPDDRRQYEFGDRDPSVAGGYACLSFYCFDLAGHAVVEIEIGEDHGRYGTAIAHLSFRIEAAALDQFVNALRELEKARFGEVFLPAARPG